MKRKLVQQGDTTLMVSLPSKWIKQHNLKKGDEVEINETENTISITTDIRDTHHKIEMNVTDFYPLVKRICVNKYIYGADEITITSQKSELLDDLPDIVKTNLIGFEVVEQSKNRIVVKEVSHIAKEEFDAMLRRSFLLVKMMGTDMIEANKNKEADWGYIIKQDDNVNRFTNFCLRIINKNLDMKSTSLYSIVYLLEQLGDSYKDICSVKKADQLFTDVHSFYCEYIDLYYNFSIQKSTLFAKKFETIKKRIIGIKYNNAESALYLSYLNEALNFMILMFNNQLNYQEI